MFNQTWENLNADMKKKDWIYLLIIIIGAIVFRLIIMTKFYAIGFDEVNYLKLAASGKIHGLNHIFHTYWSPFYPAVVAIVSYFIPNFELAGRMVSILCASAVIIPLFFFIKANFTKRIAFGTSLLIACYSFSAYYSAKAEAEFVYSLVAVIGIILGWLTLKNRRLINAFVVGVLFGFAYLSRPEGIGFLITFWGIIFILLIHQVIMKEKFKSYIFILLLSGLGFGIVSSPYLVFLRQEIGHWTISTKGTTNQQGEMYVMMKDKYKEDPFHTLSEDNTRLLEDEIYHTGGFVKAVQKPVIKISISNMAVKVFENFYKLITEDFTNVIPLFLAIFLGMGLFAKPWIREKVLINFYLLSFIIFFWFIVIPVFHITLRYFVPLLPISFIWIVKGADHFMKWFTETIKNLFEKVHATTAIKAISLIVIIVIFAISMLPEFGKRMRKNTNSLEDWAPSVEQKKAGLWLKKNGVKQPIIMAYNHAVSFYAGNYNIQQSVEIPKNKVDRLLEYAMYRRVNYLVLNDRYKQNHPLIEHLYEQRDIPSDLKLIYTDKEKNGLKTLIYELVY